MRYDEYDYEGRNSEVPAMRERVDKEEGGTSEGVPKL